MAFTARASGTVRNKNLMILVMCFGALAWFGYDGWVGYPAKNDERVKLLADSAQVDSGDQAFVRDWKGWANETPDNRLRMDKLIDEAKTRVRATDGRQTLNGWKTASEIALQRWIVFGLMAATAAAVWWFIHCQRRRVIADDATISPSPGVVIPWGNITRVDNTRWESMGIVDLTYTDAKGAPAKAKLDDYETQRKPLLEILDLLSEKAVNAEFFPKEEAAGESAPAK